LNTNRIMRKRMSIDSIFLTKKRALTYQILGRIVFILKRSLKRNLWYQWQAWLSECSKMSKDENKERFKTILRKDQKDCHYRPRKDQPRNNRRKYCKDLNENRKSEIGSFVSKDLKKLSSKSSSLTILCIKVILNVLLLLISISRLFKDFTQITVEESIN